MENKVSLSQYFGSDAATSGRFFDELGSAATPPDIMTQSVNLQEGDNDASPNAVPPLDLTPFSQSEVTFQTIPSIVSVSTSLPAANLPDPSTFFDTISPEMQITPGKTPKMSTDFLSQSLDGLSIKEPQVSTEVERRRDAWIPSEETKKTLIKAQAAPAGSFFPEREVLTMPGIILEEELPDHLQETAIRLLGVGEAASRGVLRQEHVSRDEAGLRELIRTGYLRAALALTGTLISALGQGVVGLGRPTKHTPRSLQLWLTRFALLVRLRLKESLRREAEAFGDLGKPDMFYQFYPETYGSRAGSLVPFSLRLLMAELPLHTGKADLALDRLYALCAIVRRMLVNIRAGKTEDGTSTVSPQDQSESIRLWSGRETRVQHSIVNCAVALKDFRLAIETTSRMAEAAQSDTHKRALYSALCRLCLQAGHVRSAEDFLKRASLIRNRLCPTADVREYVDLGLLDVAQGRYQEAYGNFARAAEQEPTNVMVANNTAVCLLYAGRLKEATSVLQKAIQADPEWGLSESLLLNLCTLYELESSRTRDKKLVLLRMLCKYKSDTLPSVVECLKLA